MLLRWYINNELMGESNTTMVHAHGAVYVPFSLIRFCQRCGNIWSKVEVDHPDSKWIGYGRLCIEHGPAPIGDGTTSGTKGNEEIYPIPKELQMYEFKAMGRCGGEEKYEIHLITGGN